MHFTALYRCFLLILTLLSFSKTAFSQTCPPNLDFEQGDFSSWECFIGSTRVENGRNKIILNPTLPQLGRHEIISANTAIKTDQFGGFPTLCPYGGNYSVKLGNSFVSSEAEALSYTFVVPTTVDTFTFTYFYAVVFEDPNHSLPQQPRFFVTAYDVATGDLINCASYDYVSNGSIPGFKRSSVNASVLYKEWTPASLQFAGLAGRAVRLEFRTADCTLGGHFGYAYVDVSSACSNILATAPYCAQTNSLILNAPYGFQSYTWYNSNYSTILGTEQTLTLSPPPATSGMFYVDMIPYPGFGCRDTLQAVAKPLPVPDTPVAKSLIRLCRFERASPLSATASPGNLLLWYTSATGGIGSTSPPVPSTATLGEYHFYVTQKVLFGCESFRKKITVKVSPTPTTTFLVNTSKQCQNGNAFLFTSTSTGRTDCVYYWDFGDGEIQSSPKDSVVSHSYVTAKNFTVKLRVENDSLCSNEKQMIVTVIPKPVATFTYPNTICESQTLLDLKDNSSVPNSLDVINRWWWDVNGTIIQSRNPGPMTATRPGLLPVRYVVTTAGGCVSDTNKVDLMIRHQPEAAFSMNTPLCNNEPVTFNSLSQLPSSANGEQITKWNWSINGSTGTSMQQISLQLAAGNHRAQLVTETNFGCRSTMTEKTFFVHAKPRISLNVSDSCINRSIQYNATDIFNTVDKWYWNFGNGWKPGIPTLTKTFARPGDQSFMLMASTINGCKDTIIRSFAIFDNNTYAGRDTVAAIDEPVQLTAHGQPNIVYQWTPAMGLNNDTIKNPVATLDTDQRYSLYAVTDKGCDSRSNILIKRYVGPDIYIPTGFTPNKDGKNEELRATPVGMKVFKYFAVYNRYGELVFKTTDYRKGWDGKHKNAEMGTATFVFVAEAIDYKGKPFMKKGTVTLIR
jgi:gliding motility-associated-like protein